MPMAFRPPRPEVAAGRRTDFPIRPLRLPRGGGDGLEIRPTTKEWPMCLLAILYRVCDDAPLVVGANREEYYARGGDPPRRLDGLDAVAGVDPTHGGTWLGVNSRGVLVAVTNRPKTHVVASPRSRGLLARDLLRHNSAVEAASAAARE